MKDKFHYNLIWVQTRGTRILFTDHYHHYMDHRAVTYSYSDTNCILLF